MIDLLLRLVDPITARARDAERERKRSAIPPDANPDELDVVIDDTTNERATLRVCRVCSATGSGRYCMQCLAETMVDR